MSDRFTLATIQEKLTAYTPIGTLDPAVTRRAAVAMILRDAAEAGPELVLIKRADHPDDPWSGQMAFPGGHEDHGDESLEHAARRETLEEIGLPLAGSDCIGRLDDVIGGRVVQRRIAVTPFVYATSYTGPLTLNHEVADAIWIPVGALADPAKRSPYRFPLDPEQRVFSSFVYRGYTVWGLTYSMIANLLGLLDVSLPRI
ncbi:MAG: CoA pyrophosphatase [Candidatus Hydrogenedentes bacterium]|nr:CoA pyrophosphatase [Candidatus Hydrogenedentota bacterium]